MKIATMEPEATQPKVMIVDDLKSNRVLMKSNLGNNGYDFLMVEGGLEAIDLLERGEGVDLILLDIMMPDMDGIDVLKHLKANKKLCDIPVIMVTAMEEDSSLPECLELGACDYVSKPIKGLILKARVDTQLSRKQAMDEVLESRLHLACKVEERTQELKQTISQLYQAQKLEAIGTLAGGIAHDFNNVLSSITANLYLIRRDADDGDKVRQRLPQIHEVCMQASEHIRQLLCFAKKKSVQMTVVNMQACVQAGCDMVEVAISSAINLECIYPEEALLVLWNETQIQQVLLNLVTNASHALEGVSDARIQIELSMFSNNHAFMLVHPAMQDKHYVRLSVRDNGCGMALEVQEKIFEAFYTTKEEGKGTGLGLSMVSRSIDNAKGAIEVESTVGKGTEFSMYLPLQ